MKRIPLLLLFLLAGCVADNNTRQDHAGATTTSGPTIYVPPAQLTTEKVDTSDITREIKASNETTQNQLSGLMTTSISKLETNLKDLFKLQFDTNVNATAEFKNKMEASLSALNDMKITLSNQMNATANLETKLSVLTEIKTQLQAIANTNANGQAGLLNQLNQKLDSFKASFGNVGHDVNMLPKQAVDIIVDTNKTWAYIFGVVCAAITSVAGLIARNSRNREEQTTRLLMSVLAKLHPDQTRELNLEKLFPKP